MGVSKGVDVMADSAKASLVNLAAAALPERVISGTCVGTPIEVTTCFGNR